MYVYKTVTITININILIRTRLFKTYLTTSQILKQTDMFIILLLHIEMINYVIYRDQQTRILFPQTGHEWHLGLMTSSIINFVFVFNVSFLI